MSYLGSISNFDYKSGDWILFRIRIDQFFKANSVKEENKCAILITHLTNDSCRLARNLVYPRDVEKLSYGELVKALDDHFKPKQCTFADRAKFYGATREPGESLGDWAARLRGLASFCEFGPALETVLRDRFVLGLHIGPERKKLFDQDATKLTFTEALEVAEKAASARLAKLSVQELKVSEISVKQEPIYKIGTSGGKYQGAGTGRRGAGSSRGRANAATSRQTTGRNDSGTPGFRCEVCGLRNHSAEMCRYKGYRCQKCGVKGHLKKVCKARVHKINVEDDHSEESEEDCEECKCYNIRYDNYKPIVIMIRVNCKDVLMEIDSGSSISAMSDFFYKQNFCHLNLSPCNVKMCFYNGHRIIPIGYFISKVSYNNMTLNIKFFVIKNGGAPLLGRDFMQKFKLDILPIDNQNMTYYNNNIIDYYGDEIGSLLNKYKDLWSDGLGRFNKFKISLTLKSTATPKFFKSRSVPFALKSKVDAEIDRLTSLGILVPVTHSDYATPIVPVLKNNGQIKIAGDYSLTLNRDLCIDKYPMPRVEEVFCKLGGGEKYTKLDLSNAYNQLLLDDDSQLLTTINTPRGLFKYTRLVYGLANAPAIFQRTMETLLSGIEGVSCWLDDVCLTGPTRTIHMARLREVLHRLYSAGLKLQKEKCDFLKDSVTYLGFVIDKNGLRSCPKKVQAIIDAPRPTNITELKRFLGIITYYRTFIPRASSILGPLHELLRKDLTWAWGKRQECAFNTVKDELSLDRVLTHFEPDSRLVLSVDAGPAGLGAVLEKGDEGQERPIAFASRSLSASERNYTQVQKEATAIVFGVKYFHQFLYGREKPFILKTDHRPLIAIFGKKNGVSVMAATRLQRYAIFLSAYNYEICYISSQNNVVADYFSRAPLCETALETNVDDQIRYLNFLNDSQLPISFNTLKQAVDKDKTLQTVIKYIHNGWPRKIKCKNIQPYFNCKTDLEVETGCVMRGHRIVIPSVLRERMINELHRGHFGIVKTKSIARSKLWWPGIDGDIERAVSACSVCAAACSAPPRAPPAPWPRPDRPSERIHIDYMQIAQMTFLIVVDAHRRARRSAQKGLGVSPLGASVGADLGGSSKYSSEALED
ncbi:uncharacterized protein K02A2.6-like [Manduca sexta]|uniref:uncharacterized protein K02A2.6-like n=1 Tax=Manduca sexta TaxID=7130 RepID=UPI00188F015D|nr:uncharacterized protein K02A2.6-like [Manduca sexta]